VDQTSTGTDVAHVWVVEATVDFPVHLNVDVNAPLAALYLSLGGDDLDGFVQMRPLENVRATSSVWWSLKEPVVYECRAAVRAPDAAPALLRGKELFEHVADRLTLLVGYPVRVLSVGVTYNEDMLRQCIAGELSEYDATTGGDDSFRTQLPKNAHLSQLLSPPQSALEAIRWFRHGMTSTRRVDQYLCYYIALESIAKHVPGVTRGPRRSSDGDEEAGLETQENAAIKYLISRHSHLPADARKILASIRARIAHGNADIQTLELASANLRLLQRLAADGIALVFGIDPGRLNVLQPSPIEFIAPIMRAQYSPEHDPSKRWGSLLSDAFATYLERSENFGAAAVPSEPSD